MLCITLNKRLFNPAWHILLSGKFEIFDSESIFSNFYVLVNNCKLINAVRANKGVIVIA